MESQQDSAIETAVFGGGCFWCTEAVFQQIRGVSSVEPGYCGGNSDAPTYEQVCAGDSGHIEVVSIRFDPALVSYDDLLVVFFATHDPTSMDRQGNDVGSQYRSVIFWQTPQQEAQAQACIKWLNDQLPKDSPVVTQLLPATHVWPAERYHQNYYASHPQQGYCQFVIAPKLDKLRQKFAHMLADQA